MGVLAERDKALKASRSQPQDCDEDEEECENKVDVGASLCPNCL